MIVLDTSLVGPIAIPDECGNLSSDAMVALLGLALVVPAHWPLEVANMLRSAVRRNRLTIAERDDVLMRLDRLSVTIDRESIAQAWLTTIELSDRHGLTPYDAAYIELAARRRLPLATRDKGLGSAAQAAGVVVEHFAP